jgi:hypothetical protein
VQAGELKEGDRVITGSLIKTPSTTAAQKAPQAPRF